MSFTAIDFETANSQRGSVCAVGLARVVNGEIVERASWLIKPPSGIDHFEPRNVGIHGIRAQDVVTARDWKTSLASIFRFANGGHFVAYNAKFDASVMRAATAATGIDLPQHEFYCALELAQGHLDLPRHRLNDVSEHLKLPPFEHHEAGADAIACASVVLAIARMGQLQTIADMWTRPLGTKKTKRQDSSKARTPVGGQINYTTERSLRLADLPQPNSAADPQHPFFGHTFCFTGELQSFSRLEAMAAVADCGATNRQGVTKKTSYVVIGRSDSRHSATVGDLGSSNKERKALDYIAGGQQITVLGEREFMQLLRGARAIELVLRSTFVDSSDGPSAKPKTTPVMTGRQASTTTAFRPAAGDSDVHSMQSGLEKRPEAPRWLAVLKRLFGPR
ncbi:DNA polymerase-3 subunit epsilon [Arthrobacter sp. SLBN-100]|uniref:exonuclease domain-containing protein n=1 Tax=Arthrobacter sp. SLBN-100 TaxID=2768450 RepID=UPI001168EADE|nr:exonuclease domain-containing protein [Arthrobacter sp. SLBN-100]TQJ68147.1 DNA polymerase-3 subunit epsilon [Arthrobacter sp. SLBN-100]